MRVIFVILCLACVSCNYLGVMMDNNSTATADTLLQKVEDTSLLADSLLGTDTLSGSLLQGDTPDSTLPATENVDTRNVRATDVVAFSRTLFGTPYKYASSNPAEGFDCSGFITYVFNHFNIAVPRSSAGFTHVGNEVPVEAARQGDLILFTGTETDSTFVTRGVGHMGIVTDAAAPLAFIHSSSGKANGVTITPLNDYYRQRFVKIIRVFRF